MDNFIGKDGFNWWIGVVENRMDPLNMGRCQVRIFGFHTENKQLIPTADLPWAPCLSSPNASHSFSTPKEGDYVIGFFADGQSSQNPTIMGIYPGIKQSGGSDKGFSDPRTPEQINAAPKPPEGQVQEKVGEPITAPLARGVFEGTALQKAYKERAHNCDICAGMNKDIAMAKAKAMLMVGQLRTTLEGIFSSTASNPMVEDIKSQISAAKAKIKDVQKEIKAAQDQIKELQAYAQKMQDIIQEIQNAPAELQALLQGCLEQATAGLSTTMDQIKSIATDTTKEVLKIGTDAVAQVTTIVDSIPTANT
jgi:iron-sulfur cluster repair protein YtfE (RIC family)